VRIRMRDAFRKKPLFRSWHHGCFFLKSLSLSLVFVIFCTYEFS
jgi:hypothetical protein